MADTVLSLDIGASSIKYLEVKKSGANKAPEVLSYGLIPTPSKGVQSEAAIDQDAIVEAIKRLLHDGKAKTKDAIIAIPDSKVFTRVIEVPNLSEKELANSIHWEAEQYIPMPLDEVFMDFSKLREITDAQGAKKQEILLVAASKTLVEKYHHIVELSGLIPIAMETDVLSSARALLPVAETPPTIGIANIGAQTTTLTILRQGVVSFTRSIEVAGFALTRAVAQEFNFDLVQAETYKKTYGLDQSKLEGKVYKALFGVYTTILEELKRAVLFHEKKYPNDHISSLILAGGSSLLPGLVTLLAREFNFEVQIGNAWSKFTIDAKKFPRTHDAQVFFAVACGLTLRNE